MAQQHRGHLVARPLVGQGELLAIGGGGLIYGEAREQHGHGGNTQFVDPALHHIAVEHAHLTGHHPHEKVEVRGHIGNVVVGTPPTKPTEKRPSGISEPSLE